MMGNNENYPAWTFECPGCKCNHYITTERPKGGKPVWEFNGDVDKPTFSPSIRVEWEHKNKKFTCHFNITNGKIRFRSDCTHSLKNQYIDLPEIL